MHFRVSHALVLFAITDHIILTSACGPLRRQAEPTSPSNTTTYPWFDPPDDTPSDPATIGYFVNHLCLNVRNMTDSIKWYFDAFGLRPLFNMHVSEHLSIAYIGHAQGGRNGTGYQTAEEMARDQRNSGGLIELISLEYPGWDLPSGLRVANTFSHIGIIVPDVQATHNRLKDMGADIHKAPGVPTTLDGIFAQGTGFNEEGAVFSDEEIEIMQRTLGPLNSPMMLVADPDGNVIEVQGQDQETA